MKLGEKADLVIMAEYGYGESGSPPTIPGGATLIFTV
jgi:FKBP-type peptidyl-prolyl cis-trans isomerase